MPSTIKRDWYVVDATDKVLGRLASEVARRLRGKHKPQYTPHMDTGDYVVIVNAEKIRVTGNKAEDKNLLQPLRLPRWVENRSTSPKLLQKAPTKIIERAVKGMLPKGPLGRTMFRKLKVYAGPEHKHTSQQPVPLEL